MGEPVIDWDQARKRIAAQTGQLNYPDPSATTMTAIENLNKSFVDANMKVPQNIVGGSSSVKINDELDAENDRLTWAVERIMSRSNHDSCGLYETENLHAINEYARKALGGCPTIALENYFEDPETFGDNPVDLRSCMRKVLKCLSGDLSYNDIASAKACLKEAIDG